MPQVSFVSQAAIDFFLEHAGWSYNPATQTPEEGRLECARKLAEAEQAGSEAGLSFEWSIDQTIDSSEFDDSDEPWALWGCVCRTIEGGWVSSLGGIDFGRFGTPWGQSYRRVVEAELAQEAFGS